MAQLKLLVIHSTATPPGREVSAADIRRWHCAPISKGGRGWKQVGYTDMVHLDGTVERLVENNEDDVVDPWEITNGAKGITGQPGTSCTSAAWIATGRPRRTPGRRSSGKPCKLCGTSIAASRSLRIVGHNELAAKACPSFDVQKWLKEIGINQ